MNYFAWLAQEEALTNEALTIRAQQIAPDDVDETLQDIFMPRRNVDSVRLSEIGTIDFRPVSDRREWNARGRQINTITPDLAEMEFIPVEDYFKIAEREIQKYAESTRGNMSVFRDIIRASLPDRVDDLALANIRRLEVDMFKAWSTGTIVVRHPHTGATQTVSYGFDTGRYQTAATAWDDAGLDAYAEFIAWAEDGIDEIGSAGGAVLRRATYRAIQADAPTGINGVPLTRGQFEDQVRADLGVDFRFYILETEFDIYTTGGLETTRTALWPAETIALLPANIQVGNMCYAPVVRAYDIVGGLANAASEIDVRGQNVYREVENGGRALTTECQVNAFPLPDERRMWVIDVGV